MTTPTNRDLDPHAEAIAAMYLWGEEYSRTRLGCMEFYDRLSESQKRICVDLVTRVRALDRAASPFEKDRER